MGDVLGAAVREADLSHPVDDTAFAAIHEAWLDHLVLVFRNQRLNDAQLVAFSRRFGALDIAPLNENGQRYVEGYPEILVVSNVVENGVAIGSLGSGEAAWHTDMSYVTEPPMADVERSAATPVRWQ